MENEFEVLFSKLMPDSFKFLEDEFSFTIIKEDPYKYIAFKPNCRVIMDYEKGHFFCWIENNANESQSLRHKGINVLLISICRGYHPSSEPVFYTREERLVNEIKEYSTLITEYCSDFLEGNFQKWHDIGNCLEAKKLYILNTTYPIEVGWMTL